MVLKYFCRDVFVLTVGLLVAEGSHAQAVDDMSTGRLLVTGVGTVSVVPDVATLRLGLEARKETAVAAVDKMASDMTEVVAAIEAAGIARSDIQTSQLVLRPLYPDYSSTGPDDQRKLDGFVAINQVTVHISEIDLIEVVLDGVLTKGANRFDGLQFGLSNPQPEEDAARADAVADAIRKAELLAEAAGLTLGSVLHIREGRDGSGPQPMNAPLMEARGTIPVAEGELDISRSVTIEFALEK